MISQPTLHIFQSSSLHGSQTSSSDRDHPHLLPHRRPPLDPLSPTDLHNRPSHNAGSPHHSLLASAVSDLSVLLPEPPASAGYCGMRPGATFSPSVCSWPPLVPAPGSSHSNLARHHTSPPSPSPQRKSLHPTFLVPPSAWNAPDFLQTDPTTESMRPSGWKSENLLQPIHLRTNSMPSMRRPPGELWRSDPAPPKAIHTPLDAAHSSYSTPPGLPSRQPDLKRCGSSPDLHSPLSLSLSLALGSQPLKASEPTKAVPPIGAERSRPVSTTSHRNSLVTQLTGPPWRPALLSPRLQAKWKNDVYLLDTTPVEKAQAAASKEDLERLLRHAVQNKYATKIISPLNPLRTASQALDLSTDPEYRLRMPSPSNNPSSRYSKCLPRRLRIVCDGHQTLDWDTTCMHCEECKRDTIGKRLLAFRHRQLQACHVPRARLHTFPSRATRASVGADDDCIALASRIREVFPYVVDDEERSLWEEIAAVTGVGPLPFTRVGAPCAAATYRCTFDDGADESAHDDYIEVPDSGLHTTESATLFRDVTVY